MKHIEDIRILVIGDIMLDKYIVGDVERISPEAPVPVVHVKEEYHTLGGCGNVVRNLRELGAKVDCLASVGIDLNGEIISEELKEIGANPFLFFGSTRSIVKERIIADQRKVQMLRVDWEDVMRIAPALPIDIHTRLCSKNEYDIVVVSDYAKGMITAGLMQYLIRVHKGNIIVDPKPINGGMYNGVFMVTPNEKEWESMMFSSAYNLNNVKHILVTLGSKGMNLIDNQTDESVSIQGDEVKVFNVSGAGDTVVAVMSACVSMGLSLVDAAKISNKCAGYVVTLPGTSVISKNKFTQNLNCVLGR
jgi:rfaE bifunctional protein kinase chain/domain